MGPSGGQAGTAIDFQGALYQNKEIACTLQILCHKTYMCICAYLILLFKVVTEGQDNSSEITLSRHALAL